jgi:asparagine synthase (glutamine-hydrolysing)
MCGVVGRLAPASQQRDDVVTAMAAAIVHRGPDEEGHYSDENISMRMRRLSIQDVAHGHQPATDESGDIIAMLNGELYNVDELREWLISRGHRLEGHGDTECIPHLYEELGEDFVHKLRGMYVIAIWDRRRRTLILLRDRLGKKPLYYSHVGSELAYASEMKGLLKDAFLSREVDLGSLSHYLTFQYVPAPASPLKAVRKLPPGHMLIASSAGVQIKKYWNLEYTAATTDPRTDEELVSELREKFLESVRLRMISERPLGAFLSGGLDSSAVVGAMREIGAPSISTFSIGFREDSHNELPHARRIAERFGTTHHELVVEPDAATVVPMLARQFDEPYADSSAIPSWYLADMARQHVVVALNGDGGDELLGGYTRYLRYMSGGTRPIPPWVAAAMRSVGRRIQRTGANVPLVRKAGTAAILLGDSDPVDRYARFLSYFRPEEKNELFSASMRAATAGQNSYDLVRDVWNATGNSDPINRMLSVDTSTYLPGDLLPKVDITTMSVSLEARSPLLDHTLFEWASQIPGNRKIKNGSGKHLLKLLLEGWIDHDLIHRRKQGFGIPLNDWLRTSLREMVHDLLLDDTARARGYFDASYVRGLIAEHMSGIDHGSRLYALLMLELWHREVIES